MNWHNFFLALCLLTCLPMVAVAFHVVVSNASGGRTGRFAKHLLFALMITFLTSGTLAAGLS
ncbi:hypothetical protein BS618_32325 [Rhodococcus erythropolis]|nr:hypothetical protein BS618_32325 [Rhodococcus erythropolis]